MAETSELNRRVAFDKRIEARNEYGNSQTTFAEQFVAWARVKPRLGGEEVSAARLAGRTPVNITIRYSGAASAIKTDWRARDAHSGEVWDIRSIVNPDERRQFLELLAEGGL